jgi:hypothetical protein
MKRPISDIAFTPAVKAAQEQRGSRKSYEKVEQRGSWNDVVTPDLAEFIAQRDSFYLVLLCYKLSAQQKGQQGSRPSRQRAIRMRSVAIECGLCRSARARRAAGLVPGRNPGGA